MAWTRRPTGFIPVAEGELNAMTRAIALQALAGVIERSPGDSGAFRGNNRVSVDVVDSSFDTLNVDKPGNATLAAGASEIGRATNTYQIIRIQNNLPYAERLEEGYSGQAPNGVYQVTFDALRARNT